MEKNKNYKKANNSHLISLIILPILLLTYIPPIDGQVETIPVNPIKGKLVFEKKGCKNCHSVLDQGGKIGPDLSKNLYYGSFLQLAGVMWNHAPKMFKKAKKMELDIAQFTHEEMNELITYLGYLHYLGRPGNKFKGWKLLTSKKCFKCHKIGEEGTKIGPDLSKLKQYVSPLYITQAMWNHGPAIEKQMKSMNIKFAEFKNNEIIDITAALKSYTNPNENKAEFMMPGDPNQGKKVFQSEGCLHCHSVHGKGGKLGPDFGVTKLRNSVTEIAGIMWNHGPKMWQLMQQEGIPHPNFDCTEMADVIAYIYFLSFNDQSGDIDEGKKMFSNKGCVDCHSINGIGGTMAADLAKTEEIISPVGMVQIMWNHAPYMMDKIRKQKLSWPKLEDNNVPDLYAFLKSINK